MIERQKLAELLSRPLGRGMRGHVRVENAPRTDLHCDEDIQDAERNGHRNEKVAGHDGPRMVANEGCPTLAGVSAWLATLQILADGFAARLGFPTSAIAHLRSFPHPTLGFREPFGKSALF